MNDAAQLHRLGRWLQPRLESGPVTLHLRERPRSGFSADNVVFTATVDGRSTTHVLRRESSCESPYPEQAPGLGNGVVLQASVMAALQGVVPVAPGVRVEPDPDVLGVPFLVMDYVEGVVPIEHPPCTLEGFFADAAHAVRTTMITGGLRALARVHTTAWHTTDLSCLHDDAVVPGAARQLQLWEAQLVRSLHGRHADVFERATAWMHANLPPESDDVVLIWGDSRLGNIIFDPETGEPLCLTDFEGAALGERELDLGWWLMADRWMHEGCGAARLAGEPTRAEQVAIYQDAAGVTVGPMAFYEVFAAFRFATSVVTVMNRWEADGQLPGDHTLWRDNPATEVLAAILDEQG